mmetsp:Transcript_38253/g.46132  ORF Transcript_38253/g.46132 Transcript_38253/m.46132 type:complete len:94 (+) Transcript_38253:68-349(+)
MPDRKLVELQKRVDSLTVLLKQKGIFISDPPERRPDSAEPGKIFQQHRKGNGTGNTTNSKKHMKRDHTELLERMVCHYEGLLRDRGIDPAHYE